MAVGTRLAAAREGAGLTVEDVSRATNIRGTLVRAIEAEDFAPCGGAVYARGHLRSIAAVIGLDPAELVAEFDREHGRPEPADPKPIFDPEVVERTGERRPNWSAAMATVLALVCVVAGVQLVTGDGSSRPAASSDTPGIPAPSATASVPPRVSTPPDGPVALVDPHVVTLRLLVTGAKSWVSVKNGSGRSLFQGILRKGEVRDFTDPRLIRLVIGDSGAVALVVNGRNLGRAGAPGVVSRPEFGPGDPEGAAG